MTDTGKVFLACALGSLVGSLVALQFGPHFWFVGALLGGCVGYLAYDFPKVVAAIPKAYRAARGWRPDRVWWPHTMESAFGGMGFLMTIGVFMTPLMIADYTASSPSQVARNFFFAQGLFATFGFVLGFLVGANGCPDDHSLTFRRINPFRICGVVVPREIWKAILWIAPRVRPVARVAVGHAVRFGRFLGRFSMEFLCEIHSDLRLLCGADAALGAAFGYFMGNALIGAVAGGILGVVNFEIVSIRVLKVVPATRSFLR